ncbi:MAG: nitronate monooxygenase [Actinomycetota bacterium]|nr:nitronate monooxygenase [Actinomycetota bacterium]
MSAARLPQTDFTRMVGCALPIQQAPIGYPAADPALAAAVAAAGGHGMLAAVRMAAAELSEALDALNSTTRAYGVNLIQAILDPDAFEVAADKAPLVELYIGEPNPKLIERIHSGGGIACRQVISADEARAAQEEGCDLVVARSIEAGGRAKGGIGMIPLLDSVLDAVGIPVIAAGGVGSGRGVAAALAAGAAGVRLGTRFLAAREARTHPVYLEALLAARAEDTALTEAFSVDGPPSPHRVLRSALEAASAYDGEVVGEMHVFGERRQVRRFSADNPADNATGRVEAMALYAGESVGSVRDPQPAGEIVAEVAAEASELLGRLAAG